jgi:glycosyltransferase involved in cell wall biosynthesis
VKVWIVNYGNILGKGTNPRLLGYYHYLEKQGHEPCFCFVKKGQVQPGYKVIQKGIIQLSRALFKLKPDVVYVYCPNILFFPLYFFADLMNIPIIIEKTEWDSVKPIENWKDLINKPLYWMDEKISHRFAKAMVVITRRLQQKYDAISPNKTHYIGPFIPYHASAFRSVQKTPKFTLGYLGTFGQKDDVDLIFQTVIQLQESRPELSLKCMGRVSPELRSQWEGAGITFTGELKAEEIVKELSDCQILLGLRTDHAYSHYGFPSKLTEYLASGRPIIASDVSDMSYIFTDGDQLRIIEPGNCNQLEETIIELLDQPEKAVELGLNGQKWAENQWDTEKVLASWLKYIDPHYL